MLLPEQEDLLDTVLAIHHRSGERLKERPLTVIEAIGRTGLVSPSDPELPISLNDIEELARVGLIRLRPMSDHVWTVHVTAMGLDYSRRRAIDAGDAGAQMEAQTRRVLGTEGFRRRHQAAWKAWTQAMEALWQSETPADFDGVGSHCRTAMQQFAGSLIAIHGVTGADPDVARTKNRLTAAVDSRRIRLGETASDLLDAMVAYWAALNEAMQQLHKASHATRPLTHEHARRVVFHTGFVMVEIDSALNDAT